MALVVQKYGGTSMGTVERIRNVAKRVAKTYDAGNDMVVVVSAMSGETNKLVALANEVCEFPDNREYDVLVASGEQVSIALLAMCLKSMGYKAKSYHGLQVPDPYRQRFQQGAHREDRRQEDAVRSERRHHPDRRRIPGGRQGRQRHNPRPRRLGYLGGCPGCGLKADVCEIYTDVDGVYTTDPNICTDARKIERISYDEMLELASLGAKVLQIRSVEFAKKYNVDVHVRSSFNDNPGTMVTKEDKEMEAVLVSGIAYDKNEVKIAVMQVPDKPGIAAKMLSPLSDANISVDMIVQNVSEAGAYRFHLHGGQGGFQEGAWPSPRKPPRTSTPGKS